MEKPFYQSPNQAYRIFGPITLPEGLLRKTFFGQTIDGGTTKLVSQKLQKIPGSRTMAFPVYNRKCGVKTVPGLKKGGNHRKGPQE